MYIKWNIRDIICGSAATFFFLLVVGIKRANLGSVGGGMRRSARTHKRKEKGGKHKWGRGGRWRTGRQQGIVTLEFVFFFNLGQFCFFPKGYIFVFDMIHPVSFILFLIKPSSNVFMLLFFQRLKIPQTSQHKMHENFRLYCWAKFGYLC